MRCRQPRCSGDEKETRKSRPPSEFVVLEMAAKRQLQKQRPKPVSQRTGLGKLRFDFGHYVTLSWSHSRGSGSNAGEQLLRRDWLMVPVGASLINEGDGPE